MFHLSNYYGQSIGLPAKNSYQLMLLKGADASVFLREVSKVGIVIGLVSSAVSAFLNFNSTTPLVCTAVCMVSWGLSRTCAQQLEPEAKQMIEYFKDVRDGKDW